MIYESADLILTGDDAGKEEIANCLRVLLGTIAGEMQMDREFGVSMDGLDQPLPIAQAAISADLVEKIRKYEPRVEVEAVTYTGGVDGALVPKVVCKIG